MLRLHPVDRDAPSLAELDQARQVLRVESQALAQTADTLGPEFLTAVDCILESTGLLVVCGMGKAGLIGQKVAATLASTGTRSFFLHPAEAGHGDLGRVAAGDIVLAFSHSGETAEMIQLLGSIQAVGARVIAVTSRRSSTLARASEVTIGYGPIEEACPIGLAPSTSCAVMLGIGDALAFVLMRRRAFGHEDFGRFHPAGSLGRKLLPVESAMRRGDQLRIAPSHQTIREVLVQTKRSGRRSGAIMLIDRAGRLEGIFTDSDLARLFEKRAEAAFDRPIAESMTRAPITLRTGQRMLDALGLFRDFQVSEIPVLDAQSRPIGLIDLTDLVDLLPKAA